MRFGVVFDLDDTILSTSRVYYEILLELMEYIFLVTKPRYVDPQRILDVWKMFDHQDNSTARACRYYDSVDMGADIELSRPDKFPRRLAEIFIEIMLEAGVFPADEQVRHVFRLGKRIFTADYFMLPGALHLIDWLSRRHDTLMFVVTHGSEELQAPKINSRKVFERFQKIVVVPMTTNKADVLVSLKDEFDDVEHWIMIGDSVVRDINPGLVQGFLCLHVKHAMDDREHGKVVTIGSASSRYIPFENLSDVEHYLKEVVYADARKKRKKVPLKARGRVPLHTDKDVS